MVTITERRYSLDEYRAIAETAKEKCEYHDGEIVTMTGGTLNHSLVMGNIFFFLRFLLRDTQFMVVNSDLRLWIPEYSRGVYPDAMVFDGVIQLNGDRQDEVLNPILIVEVLSTEEHDRNHKFRMYRSLPSFSEYLLVRQNEPLVERYRKQAEGWLFSDFDSLESSIVLDSVNVELGMSEIYRGITF
jgi:Uma2 family endonuclease